MSNFLRDGDASPENDDQSAHSIVAGQTGAGKSTLMMTFFNPFLNATDHGDNDE